MKACIAWGELDAALNAVVAASVALALALWIFAALCMWLSARYSRPALLWRRLGLRLRWLAGKAGKLIGLCRACGFRSPLNYTRNGQAICPQCGARY